MTRYLWNASALALTGSVLAFVSTSPAWAQDASLQVSEPSQVEDIVVTAQKRSENLQEVPITITAYASEKLENSGVTSTSQLTTLTPGLTMRQTNGGLLPTIRGIGTSGSFVENPTGIYVDGVYLAQQQSAGRELNDIAQVAILKGPQGTLFGRNSTAGVIQITTLAPSHDFRAEVGASLDNYQTIKTDFYVTGGLTNSLAASLSAYYGEQGEGYGKNYTTGNDTYRMDLNAGVRAKLLFEPTDLTSVTLIGEYAEKEMFGLGRQPYPGTSYAYPGFGPVGSGYDTYGDIDGGLQTTNRGVSATIEHDFGFANFLSISSWRQVAGETTFDNDGVGRKLAHSFTPSRPSETWTQELQLSSPDDGSPLKWVLGAFYFRNRDEVVGITSAAPPFAPAVATLGRTGDQLTESYAVFGQATWAVIPGTNLTAGVRYTTEQRDYSGTQSTQIGAGLPNVVARSGSVEAEKPTFRFALDHEFAPDVLGYVSYNTGFKSGGFNLLAPLNAPYEPETLNAYEAGLKTRLFDRRLRLNGSAFFYDYSNIQVGQIINNQTQISNGAKAELYGLDVDFEAVLTGALTLSGGFEVLHTEFKEYPNAQVSIIGPTGLPIIGSGSVAGNRLPGAQEFSANLALDYDAMIQNVELHYNLTASYGGDYMFEPDNLLTQDAVVMLNSSLKAVLPNGQVSVTLWGRNLLDEQVMTNASASAPGFNAIHESAPRTFGVSVRYSF